MGEGSFFVTINPCKTIKIGYQVKPIFMIKLIRTDSEILQHIQKWLGCGHVHFSEKAVAFRVSKLTDLVEIIIPFFDQHPLLNIKRKDFTLFKIICYKVLHGEGRTKEGLNKILTIRDLMNNGGHVRRRKIKL
ncbi:MAG TPA: endonuclease [Brevibacillus sp.]|nr:endonuclease [Brevibacillus sp.]